jgi:hypothetical protein
MGKLSAVSTGDPLQRARRVVRAAGVTALVAGALLLVSIPRAVEVCKGALIEVPEPPLWRRQPKQHNDSPGLGEFGYASKTELGPDGVRTGGARVYDRNFCSSSGLRLDRWLALRLPSSSSLPELSIQRDPESDVFTISSEPAQTTASRLEHVHIVSFRRDPGTRLSVVSGEGLAVALLLAAGAALAGCGAWLGRRDVRVARAGLFASLLVLAVAASIRVAMFLNERAGYDWMAR